MLLPQELAHQIRYLRTGRTLKAGDGLIRETIRLPLEQARAKARQTHDAYPAGGYMTVVENWRQHAGGQMEFTVRRLPAAD